MKLRNIFWYGILSVGMLVISISCRDEGTLKVLDHNVHERSVCGGIDDWGDIEYQDIDDEMTLYLNDCFNFDYPAFGCQSGSYLSQESVLCDYTTCNTVNPLVLDAVLEQFEDTINDLTPCRPEGECTGGHFEFVGVYVVGTSCTINTYSFALYYLWICCSGSGGGPGGGGGN